MKKNGLLYDDSWDFQTRDVMTGAPTAEAAQGTMFRDDGDFFPLAAAGSVFELVVSAAKPVASIATLADYLVNGFWAYNSTPAHHFTSNTISYNITGLNAAEQFLAQTAMQAWSEVANISFIQTSSTASITFTHNGTMQAYTSGFWSGSGAISSQTVDISADWITNDGGAYDGKTGIDSYGYQTYIHEIGHALGLGHQGPYNGSAVYSTNAVYANDTWQYSVMSYFSEQNYSGSSYRYVVTPQMADIYAMATMYGAAASTRTGDTVYGFNSNAGAVFNFAGYSSAPALTIYDSGGNDTLDCSGYSAAQIIDLHAGAFSSVGGLTNNIGIALNAVIEKAIGGSGNDRLTASDAGSQLWGGGGNDILIGGSGNDRLLGGSGADTLTGGGSGDTFVFLLGDSSAANGQHDRITDFLSGTDRIDLSGYDAISSTGGYDQFKFIATTAFHGAAGELNYFYNSSSGVTTLQGDTNGDSVADFAIDLTGAITINLADLIGVYSLPVTVEAVGATTLTQVGSAYYLYANGTTTGPTLKFNGVAYVAGEYGGWTPVAVEAKAGGGYQVAWKVAGADQYTVWYTDANGNFTSNATGGVSGSAAALVNFEPVFQQDLNGDGVIGSAAVTVEAAGATSLVKSGSTYYLYANGTTSGPSLKFNSIEYVAGEYGDWAPISVEAKAGGGYQVAWKVAGSDQYTIWYTDANGNFTTNATGGVSGSAAALVNFESSFQQDLNGDGTIGAGALGPAIEALGSTSLVKTATTYYLYAHGTTSGPSLKFGGVAYVAGEYGDWAPIAVETKAGGGYEVAWKVTGSDQYTVWYTDANGNFTTNATAGGVSGSADALKNFETSFVQDLNGDGVIGVAGVAGTAIEAVGATSLVKTGSTYYLYASGTTSGPSLKFNGIAYVAGEYDGWTPTGVEAKAGGGYQVAWKVTGADQYTVWYTDANGNFTSNATGGVSGSAASLKNFETVFLQDLNGDGVIGTSQVALGQNSAAGRGDAGMTVGAKALSTSDFWFAAVQPGGILASANAGDRFNFDDSGPHVFSEAGHGNVASLDQVLAHLHAGLLI